MDPRVFHAYTLNMECSLPGFVPAVLGYVAPVVLCLATQPTTWAFTPPRSSWWAFLSHPSPVKPSRAIP